MRTLLVLTALLSACAPNIRESCEVLKSTLYGDGAFSFTDAEIDALRQVNQVKLDAVKRYYRGNCVKSAR